MSVEHVAKPGQIILLNSPTSVGKTSVAKFLRAQLNRPFLHLGTDTWLLEVFPSETWGTQGKHRDQGFSIKRTADSHPPQVVIEVGPYGFFLFEGLHEAVRSLSVEGHNVIMDHCFWEAAFLQDCVQRFQHLPILFVRLHCPLEIIQERWDARSDRSTAGLPEFWYQRTRTIDQAICYDLEIDTSIFSPEECAEIIRKRLEEGHHRRHSSSSRSVTGYGVSDTIGTY